METDTGNPENGSIEDEIVNNLCTDGISDATTSAAQPYFSENSIELASASSSFVASTPLSRSRRIIKVLTTLRLTSFGFSTKIFMRNHSKTKHKAFGSVFLTGVIIYTVI